MFGLLKYFKFLRHLSDKLDEQNRLTQDRIKDAGDMISSEETFYDNPECTCKKEPENDQ